MLKEQEARMPTTVVCRKHGLSQGTFYKFKSQYSGMEVSDEAKLPAVTNENAKPRGFTVLNFMSRLALLACPISNCCAIPQSI